MSQKPGGDLLLAGNDYYRQCSPGSSLKERRRGRPLSPAASAAAVPRRLAPLDTGDSKPGGGGGAIRRFLGRVNSEWGP